MDEITQPFKELWGVLWRHKPLLFGLIAVAAVLIYLWWKNGGTQQPAENVDAGYGVPVDSGLGQGVPGVVTGGTSAQGGQTLTDTSGVSSGQPALVPSMPVLIPIPGVPLYQPGQPIQTTPTVKAPRTYLVVAGDTLSGVARKLGLTPNQLYNDNRGALSLVSAKHGGPYWDTGKATKTPPAGVKLYAGTVLHF